MTQKEIEALEAREILERISAVAKRRRSEAESALTRQLPPWLLEIRQTEVAYTINPNMLPVRVVSFPALRSLLAERYSVEFSATAHGRAIPPGANVSEDEIGAFLLRNNDRVRFENGKFMHTANDFIIISSISLSYESIHVVVQGVSQVAELIVAEVAEILWAASGASKRWDDIKSGVQLIGYGNSTVIDLGVSLERMLSNEFVEFFSSNMMDGPRYAYATGRRSVRHDFSVSPTLNAVWGLDELSIRIFLFDSMTGRPETTRIDLGVLARDEMGTGRIRAYSELPFDAHIECLGKLRSTISKNGEM